MRPTLRRMGRVRERGHASRLVERAAVARDLALRGHRRSGFWSAQSHSLGTLAPRLGAARSIARPRRFASAPPSDA